MSKLVDVNLFSDIIGQNKRSMVSRAIALLKIIIYRLYPEHAEQKPDRIASNQTNKNESLLTKKEKHSKQTFYIHSRVLLILSE